MQDTGYRVQGTGFRIRGLRYKMFLGSCILHLASCVLVSAKPPRPSEPVPSAAAQMFMQLETGDWILKAEALDYLSRYDVPNAGPAVQKVLDDKHPNNRWLRGQAVIAMARIAPDNAAALAMPMPRIRTPRSASRWLGCASI